MRARQVIHELLTSDLELMALVTGVHSYVPQERSYPYVVISESNHTNDDTSSDFATEVIADIHVYSRVAGFKEIDLISRQVCSVLNHADIEDEGVDWCVHQTTRQFVEPDGKTFHGIIQFKLREYR